MSGVDWAAVVAFGVVVVVIAAVVWGLGYAALCAWSPFRLCPLCRGSGMERSPVLGLLRGCRSCRATGARLRWGWRAWRAWRRARARSAWRRARGRITTPTTPPATPSPRDAGGPPRPTPGYNPASGYGPGQGYDPWTDRDHWRRGPISGDPTPGTSASTGTGTGSATAPDGDQDGHRDGGDRVIGDDDTAIAGAWDPGADGALDVDEEEILARILGDVPPPNRRQARTIYHLVFRDVPSSRTPITPRGSTATDPTDHGHGHGHDGGSGNGSGNSHGHSGEEADTGPGAGEAERPGAPTPTDPPATGEADERGASGR